MKRTGLPFRRRRRSLGEGREAKVSLRHGYVRGCIRRFTGVGLSPRARIPRFIQDNTTTSTAGIQQELLQREQRFYKPIPWIADIRMRSPSPVLVDHSDTMMAAASTQQHSPPPEPKAPRIDPGFSILQEPSIVQTPSQYNLASAKQAFRYENYRSAVGTRYPRKVPISVAKEKLPSTPYTDNKQFASTENDEWKYLLEKQERYNSRESPTLKGFKGYDPSHSDPTLRKNDKSQDPIVEFDQSDGQKEAPIIEALDDHSITWGIADA